jgi:3-oxoacyl-[acyl-carrier protein] reductase
MGIRAVAHRDALAERRVITADPWGQGDLPVPPSATEPATIPSSRRANGYRCGMAIDIRGKWALVTGASRGIGLLVAGALAEHGANIVLHARERSNLDEAKRRVDACGVRSVTFGAELSDSAAVEKLCDEAIGASGGIDILYSNAAIMTAYRKDWMAVPADDFRRSFEVNVIAPIMMTHRLLPHMLEKRWGRIVQVTSGIQNEPELVAYAISKGALDKFVRDTACKLRGTGVLMNLLDPGWLRTDLGGPHAPNAPESVLPGALVPVLLEGEEHGVVFRAQDYAQR